MAELHSPPQGRYLIALWHWLTEPHPSIQDPVQQRLSRLLAYLLVCIMPTMILLALVFASRWSEMQITLTIVSALLLLIPYRLNRAGHYQPAAALSLVMASLIVLLVAAVQPENLTLLTLSALTVPIIAAAMLLRHKAMIAYMAFNLIGILVFPLFVSHVTLGDIAVGPLVMILMTALLLASLMNYHAWIEHDRQAQIAASERRLRLITDNMQDMIGWVDEQGYTRYISPSIRSVLGCQPEALIDQTFLELVHPDDVGHMIAAILGARETRSVMRSEYRLRHTDGHYLWVETIANGLLDADGGGMLFVSRDISERKKAEEALLSSQQLNNIILSSLGAHLAVLDRNGIVLMVNEAWRKFARENGSPPQVNIDAGANYLTVCRQASQDGDIGARQALEEIQQVMTGERGEFYMEYPCHSPDEERWFSMRVTPLVGIGGAVIVHTNITARKKAELALYESEDRYRTLLEYLPISVRVYSPATADREILYINPAGAAMFGAGSPEELLGRSMWDFVLPEWRALFVERGRRLEAGLPVEPVEYQLPRLDGQRILAETRSTPIVYQGRPAVLSITQDITARKQGEAQRLELALETERNRVLRRFIDEAASHDMRTPLTVMRTSTYLLRKVTDPERRQHHLEKLEAQLSDLEGIIESLLSMSHLYKTDVEMSFAPVDVNLLVREVLMEHQMMIASRRHEAVFTAAAQLPLLQGDADSIHRALAHILRNAITYTPEHGLIEVATALQAGEILVEIRDNGIGISPEELPLVFEPFYKVDKARTKGESGMGLGLTIARRIVELHKGRIEAESVPGQGSVFRVWLPAG